MTDVVEEIRCALAMQDAGYAVLFDHKTSAELLRRYDVMTKALEQIAIVCTDNMDRSCDHRMALDFVRQIANDASDLVGSPRGQT